MFHTFNVDSDPPRAKPIAESAFDADPPRKRHKVSKACDRCRLFRVKCGDKPCSQCLASNVKCVTSMDSSASQKPKIGFAIAPVEGAPATDNALSPAVSRPATASVQHPPTHNASPEDDTRNAPCRINEYYGLDRPIYFFAKIDEFFAGPRSTKAGAAYNYEPFPPLPNPTTPAPDDQPSNEPLSRDQHSYFLRLFWEAYHRIIQVPSELDFRVLYDTLWKDGAQKHQIQGALVDCMTALGMQYGHGADLASRVIGLRETPRRVVDDVSWAGIEYFSRCRNYVTRSTDVTLVGMQCYALMALYLLNASDFNAAYAMLGTAIRNAHSINLHREPDEQVAADQKDTHRRVWWLLFTLDIRCSLQLRKPFAVQPSVITCALPSNDLPGSSYFTHAAKLAIALSRIDRLASTIDMCSEASNIAVLEHRAAALSSALTELEQWRRELPVELLNTRQELQNNVTESMSTAESPLLFEIGVPNWLQRQRVLLEVHYHNAYIMLQRPFICFPRDLNLGQVHQPQTDQHTRSALQHAVVMAVIIHGVCSNSDALLGWPEVLQPLWNATVAILAFILANPLCQRSPGARSTIAKVSSVFEAFADNDSLAARANEATRLLSSRLDAILAKLGEGSRGSKNTNVRNTAVIDGVSSMVNSSTLLSPKPTASMPPISPVADDSLHSWLTTLNPDEWTEYQNGLDGFLGNAFDDFIQLDVPQLPI